MIMSLISPRAQRHHLLPVGQAFPAASTSIRSMMPFCALSACQDAASRYAAAECCCDSSQIICTSPCLTFLTPVTEPPAHAGCALMWGMSCCAQIYALSPAILQLLMLFKTAIRWISATFITIASVLQVSS